MGFAEIQRVARVLRAADRGESDGHFSKGMLAISYGSRVQMWNEALKTKAKSPYLNHQFINGNTSVRRENFVRMRTF